MTKVKNWSSGEPQEQPNEQRQHCQAQAHLHHRSTPEQVVEFHRVAATILGDPRKCIMTCFIGLILELPPKAPVPTYRHSIHLHSKRCRIALGRTWQKLLQRYPFLASIRIRLPWFLPTCCALGQHNSPRTHNAVQYHQYPKKNTAAKKCRFVSKLS